jgi:hypothetical protein
MGVPFDQIERSNWCKRAIWVTIGPWRLVKQNGKFLIKLVGIVSKIIMHSDEQRIE